LCIFPGGELPVMDQFVLGRAPEAFHRSVSQQSPLSDHYSWLLEILITSYNLTILVIKEIVDANLASSGGESAPFHLIARCTNHGRSVAVLLSRADYDRLAGTSQSLVDFMRCSPLYGQDDLVIERDRSLTREVEL
jgi:hypothetical protein